MQTIDYLIIMVDLILIANTIRQLKAIKNSGNDQVIQTILQIAILFLSVIMICQDFMRNKKFYYVRQQNGWVIYKEYFKKEELLFAINSCQEEEPNKVWTSLFSQTVDTLCFCNIDCTFDSCYMVGSGGAILRQSKMK